MTELVKRVMEIGWRGDDVNCTSRKTLFGWSTRLSERIDPMLRHVHATLSIPSQITAIMN
jgi:hypothetical protein